MRCGENESQLRILLLSSSIITPHRVIITATATTVTWSISTLEPRRHGGRPAEAREDIRSNHKTRRPPPPPPAPPTPLPCSVRSSSTGGRPAAAETTAPAATISQAMAENNRRGLEFLLAPATIAVGIYGTIPESVEANYRDYPFYEILMATIFLAVLSSVIAVYLVHIRGGGRRRVCHGEPETNVEGAVNGHREQPVEEMGRGYDDNEDLAAAAEEEEEAVDRVLGNGILAGLTAVVLRMMLQLTMASALRIAVVGLAGGVAVILHACSAH
ncbi:hypothetical protein Cni_G17802 [Canna indica]|uniref:Uncharacterized protein n=1 Tax=Canna indica TaxID=4628 RepID=A0AAQ3KIA8_9LILI|nr:hypothetical protein Cni_G17802 [Canna indica]